MVMVMKLVPVVVVAAGLVVAARLVVAASLVVVVYLVRVLERLERRVRVVVYLVVVYLGMAAVWVAHRQPLLAPLLAPFAA